MGAETMKLAILIPTFNRSKQLAENLSKILEQTSAKTVAIYVSDNCSTDDTESVMQEFQKTHPSVFYKRNSTNIGFDENLISLMKWAEGDYVWFLGDDDYVLDDAIERVLDIINREGVDALILNGAARPGMRPKSRLVTRLYDDLNEIARDLWQHASWMSSIVIRRQLLNDFDTADLKGSQFIHLQALFYALSRQQRIRMYCSNEIFMTHPVLDDIVNSYSIHTLYNFLDRWEFNISRLPATINANTREICFMQSPIKSGGFIRLKGQGAYAVKDLIKYKRLIARKGLMLPAVAALLFPTWLCRLILRTVDRRRRNSEAALR